MMNNTYSPIRETAREGTKSYFHEEPSSIWCGCFRFPCFPSTQKEGEANSLLQERENRDSWIVKNMKELKEYSELVAGPKWKSLIVMLSILTMAVVMVGEDDGLLRLVEATNDFAAVIATISSDCDSSINEGWVRK
ncbi:hypothetical protein H5410_002636 [Solanum commersonii]|uniref:Uncharacterized protein n=1 Tax=Solanum commersonii TaxID=4109 RepID=A0A9J6B3F0_SOLCO|nr:hypothetical protein H5410_002636 [Solanum commersonii]